MLVVFPGIALWHAVSALHEGSIRSVVDAGEQPTLTPRKLTLMNTTTQAVIQDLHFPTSVLAVRMNRKRYIPEACCSCACIFPAPLTFFALCKVPESLICAYSGW